MGIEMGLMALTAVTAVGSAVGQISQGMSEKTAASNAAIQEDQNAQLAMQAAGQEISQRDYEAEQTLGKIRANAGAAGVTMQGSPGLVYTASAQQQQINDMYTRYSGRLQSVRDLYQGEVDRYAGNKAMIGGFMSAGGSLVSGLTKGLGIAQQFSGFGTSSSSLGSP